MKTIFRIYIFLFFHADILDCITISRQQTGKQVFTQQLGRITEPARACGNALASTHHIHCSLRHVWICRGVHLSYSRPRYQAEQRLTSDNYLLIPLFNIMRSRTSDAYTTLPAQRRDRRRGAYGRTTKTECTGPLGTQPIILILLLKNEYILLSLQSFTNHHGGTTYSRNLYVAPRGALVDFKTRFNLKLASWWPY